MHEQLDESEPRRRRQPDRARRQGDIAIDQRRKAAALQGKIAGAVEDTMNFSVEADEVDGLPDLRGGK